VLSVGLCGAAFATGLIACVVRNANHRRAEELARLQREWEMLAAANAQMAALVEAHVWGVANRELDVTRPRARGRGHE
jgi:hypothetical protein